jgi:hypothetical protein
MTNFKNFTFKPELDTTLNNSVIVDSINKFWNKEIKPLSSETQVNITYDLKFYRDKKNFVLLRKTLINYNELDLLKGLVTNLLTYNNDDILRNNIIDKIIIRYSIMDFKKIEDKTPKIKILNYNIPMTMDLEKWGETYLTNDNLQLIKKNRSNLIYQVEKIDEFTNNVIVSLNNINNIFFSFTDLRNEGDPINTFVRVYNHHIYYIYNGNRFFKLNKRINNNNLTPFFIIYFFNLNNKK